MPTPKTLALRALERTTDCFREAIADFPLELWRRSPGGQANSLLGILEHLIWCEDWWRLNIGSSEREDEATIRSKIDACQSAGDLVDYFISARGRLLEMIAELPDEFFGSPVPTCEYGNLKSGAELCFYIGEHDFYHSGQVRMLEMAFAGRAGG